MNELTKVTEREPIVPLILRWLEGRAFWIMIGVLIGQHLK